MRYIIICLSLITVISLLGAAPAGDGDAKELFNGKDLTGWEGDAKFWSVEDGAITGRTTAENLAKHNTFLIWKGGTVSDFELRIKFKIAGGNSGVQYRSKDSGDHVVTGYQADIDDAGKFSGILYEEKGRGILANRGEQVVLQSGAKPKVTGSVGEAEQLAAAVKKGEWNEYVITAKGNHLVHEINGVKTVDVTDEDAKNAKAEGILALQVHTGPPMTVQFKDVRLKELPK